MNPSVSTMSVVSLLRSSNEWFTEDEVEKALRSPRCLGSTARASSKTLLDGVFSDEIFSIRVLRLFPRATPGDDAVEFFHAVPEDPLHPGLGTSHFGTIYDLPLALKTKLLEKIETMHARGEVSRPAPLEMYMMTLVDLRLEALGLLEPRPRPEHGLQYTCRWRAQSYPPPIWSRSSMETIRVSFTGMICTAQPLLPSAPEQWCASPNHFDSYAFDVRWGTCTIRQYREFATLTIDNVDYYSVKPQALQPTGSLRDQPEDFWHDDLTEPPTRRKILKQTRRILEAAAAKTPAAVPFMPIKCRFRLLTKQAAEDPL